MCIAVNGVVPIPQKGSKIKSLSVSLNPLINSSTNENAKAYLYQNKPRIVRNLLPIL